MKKTILVSLAVAAVSAVILACSRTTRIPLANDVRGLTPNGVPAMRAEDRRLLDEFAAKLQADNELWFMSGGDTSSVIAKLKNIDQARSRLAQVEFEKARLMELGVRLASSGQLDPEIFYVSLKSMENERDGILASIGAVTQ